MSTTTGCERAALPLPLLLLGSSTEDSSTLRSAHAALSERLQLRLVVALAAAAAAVPGGAGSASTSVNCTAITFLRSTTFRMPREGVEEGARGAGELVPEEAARGLFRGRGGRD